MERGTASEVEAELVAAVEAAEPRATAKVEGATMPEAAAHAIAIAAKRLTFPLLQRRTKETTNLQREGSISIRTNELY